MSQLSIHSYLSSKVTLVSNRFLDEYMPRANGEFIKIYLYLLRITGQEMDFFSLASIADHLNCTEKDVLRALRYWEQESILSLTFNQAQELEDICFLPLWDAPASVYSAAAATSASLPKAEPAPPSSPTPTFGGMSLRKLQELQQKEEVQQLLFVASQYMGRPLSSIESEKILFFYEELHLSADLIEYLIESCISKKHTSIHYMEKVALSWAEKGISTVDMAKQNNSTYHGEYYAILKSLGITGREPVAAEITYMNTWMNEYGFTLDIIKEACQRAAMQTFRPGMKYANGILKDWHQRNVKHVSDIDSWLKKNTSEDAPPEKVKTSAQSPSDKKNLKNKNTTNRFNNFPQRSQDFSQLEKQLLNK